MIDIILDTLIDNIKLLPFLFLAFIIIELIEHKLSKNNKNVITKSKKYGPIIGSIFGVIPQCGFSVLASNLYISRIITLGTLISIYLSTSDEMLPILISEKVDVNTIIKILLLKILFGMLYGIIIDFILRKQNRNNKKEDYHICEEEHCHCEKGIIIPAIKHTLNIFIFLLVITFIINIIFHFVGESFLSKLLLKNSILSPLLTSLIGLIPNCGSSVLLTELFIKNIIGMPELISGLLTNCGTATIVLFKNNKNMKENIKIIAILYLLGVLSGIVLKLF